MQAAFVDIISLACGVAGWFYLFYSKAASRLSPLEPANRNALRIGMRRVCGVAMFLLGIAFFAGFNSVDDRRNPVAYLAVWLAAMLLLALIVALVAADVHLTGKIRRGGGKSADHT
jgi:sterol desaturase/sphingolipid hydroxylase (fatty acid hydroxylase superfamily)